MQAQRLATQAPVIGHSYLIDSLGGVTAAKEDVNNAGA